MELKRVYYLQFHQLLGFVSLNVPIAMFFKANYRLYINGYLQIFQFLYIALIVCGWWLTPSGLRHYRGDIYIASRCCCPNSARLAQRRPPVFLAPHFS